MFRIQKYLILSICLLFSYRLSAQEELDSNTSVDEPMLKDLIWIKDSFYGILKTHRFSHLKVMYPSFRTYRDYIDSSQAGKQSSITQYAMYNNFWNSMYIQFYKALRKSDKAGLDLDFTRLDSFYIDTGYSDNLPYAYVNIIVKYKAKRRYQYSALFLQMKDKWFIIGDIKFVGLVVDKKKAKKKKKK